MLVMMGRFNNGSPARFSDGMSMMRSCHERGVFRKCSGVRLPRTFVRWNEHDEVLS